LEVEKVMDDEPGECDNGQHKPFRHAVSVFRKTNFHLRL